MNPVTNIIDLYIGHIQSNFGAHPRALGLELPHFMVVETENGLKVGAKGSEAAISCLEKALEVYAETYQTTVTLNGDEYRPQSLAA